MKTALPPAPFPCTSLPTKILGIDAFAVQASNDEIQSRFEVTPRNWVCPRYGGIMVFAGQTDTSHVKTVTVAADMDVYRTWRMYRV